MPPMPHAGASHRSANMLSGPACFRRQNERRTGPESMAPGDSTPAFRFGFSYLLTASCIVTGDPPCFGKRHFIAQSET